MSEGVADLLERVTSSRFGSNFASRGHGRLSGMRLADTGAWEEVRRQMKGGRRQRGNAYLAVLVIAILTTMIATTMIVNSTAGISGEALRDAQDRARCNAESGLTLADFRLKRDLPRLFKRVVEAANAEPGFTGTDMLVGLHFDPKTYHFTIPGQGNTADDAADVRVEITLPAPPVETSPAGVAAGPELGAVETYCFVAHIRSTGRTDGGVRMTAERISHAYVTLVMGEVDGATMADLGSGNVLVGEAGSNPWLDEQERRGAWDLVPPAYAAGRELSIGDVHLEQIGIPVLTVGGVPTGSWRGAPAQVGAFTGVGLDNGDKYYYAYVKGLPSGSYALGADPSVGDTPGTHGYVLATDDWRFAAGYRASDDTVPIQEAGGAIVRKQGSPNYAVVAVQAPSGLDAARWNPVEPLRFSVFVAGVGAVQYEVTDRTWQPNTHQDTALGERLIGWPNAQDSTTPNGYTGVVDGPATAAAINLRFVDAPSVEAFVGTISVPGEVPANGNLVGTGGSGSTVPGMIPLLAINGRRANVSFSYDGASGRVTAATRNSAHLAANVAPVNLGGGQVIVDPPPPGTATQVRIIAVLYVPLWTQYIPETVSGKPADGGHR